MGWESFCVVRFDLGPLLQGQTRITKLIHRVRYAAATRREIFGINALKGKLHQLGSPNLQDIFIVYLSFSGTENSLILKNKMAAAGISLKIIYIFLLAVSHR